MDLLPDEQKLIMALVAQLQPDTPPEARQKALQYTEAFKQGWQHSIGISAKILAQCATPAGQQAFGDKIELVCHFFLHAVESVVKRYWTQLNGEQHEQVKGLAWNLIKKGEQFPREGHVHQKIAVIASEIAIREWPQRWANLVTDLIPAASSSHSVCHIAVLILRNIAEEVKAFNPNLPEKRRREIQQGVSASMKQLFPFCFQLLLDQLKRFAAAPHQNEHSRKLITDAFDLLSNLLEIAPPEHPFSHNMISHLAHFLKLPDFFENIVSVLKLIADRKQSHIDPAFHMQMNTTWQLALSTSAALTSSNFPEGMKRRFLLKTLSLLTALCRHWMALVLSDTAEARSHRQQLFGLLVATCKHSSLLVSRSAIDLIAYLFRFEKELLKKDNALDQLVHHIYTGLLCRVVKPPPDVKDEQFEEGHTFTEYKKEFATLRGATTSLMGSVAKHNVVVASRVLLADLSRILSQPMKRDYLNENGLCTVHTTFYRELDAVCCAFEILMKSCTRLWKPEWQAPQQIQFRDTMAEFVMKLIGVKTQEPIILHRILQTLSPCSALVSNVPKLLQPLLNCLFEGLGFRLPQEQGLEPHMLSEDTRSARKRASYSLISLGQRRPENLLVHMNSICSKVQDMLQTVPLLDGEKNNLFEFLVTISNAMRNPAEQHGFIKSVLLKHSLAMWQSNNVTQVVTQPAAFLAILDPVDQKLAAIRRDIRTCVASFDSIFRRIPMGADSLNTKLLLSLVPSVLGLVKNMHYAWSAEASQKLPPAVKEVLQISSVEKKGLLGERVLRSDRENDPVTTMRSWLNVCRESAYHVLALASKAGTPFYQSLPPPALASSVFSNLSCMEDRHMKSFLMAFFQDYALHCPARHFNTHLGPFLRGAMVVVYTRLSHRWSTMQKTGVEGEEKDEILVDKLTRELSRTFVDVLIAVLHVEVIGPGRNRAPSPAPSENKQPLPPPNNDMLEYLLSREELIVPLLESACCYLEWPDTATRTRICNVLQFLIPHCEKRQPLYPHLGRVMQSCIKTLATLQADLVEPHYMSLVTVVFDVYFYIGRHSPIPRSVLCSIPDVTPQHANNLEEVLSTVMAEKKHRRAMRELLFEFVLGKNAISNQLKTTQIANLPEPLMIAVGPKQATEDDHSGDIFQLIFK